MSASTTGGLAGTGLVLFVFGLSCIYWWRCWPTIACWSMLAGGVCFAVAGAPPLIRAGNIVSHGAGTVAGWFGAGAGAAMTAITLVLAVHVGRALYPSKKQKTPVTADKGHQWAALVVPVFLALAGGVVAFVTSIAAMGSSAMDHLSSFLGS